MNDLDHFTGEPIDNLSSACQCVELILSTRIGSMPMLREFGGGVVELLGRKMSAPLFALWKQLVGTAIDIWEPRFRVRRVTFDGSVEQLRRGGAGMVLEVDYRPRGHLGDMTVERVLSLSLVIRDNRLRIFA